ncbi:Cysteine protease-like protein [Methanocaldococcus vulcanius M7]|uniref:Cysteine protease-like protein n=1 Tax=Methanocaldococcus vulcanius (strain ATCC 700851 / DSM 12094 / M7) TaxID=579137 RepID=C9RGN7_METVM|nr:C1 family peptidase [Methanocaldococcus vulcanius]ACX72739.1 Cysteine protease-like protein [Methanocaldococcus vulcanius M7]
MKKVISILLILLTTISLFSYSFGEVTKYRTGGCIYIPFKDVQKIHPNLYKKVDNKTLIELLAKSPNPKLLKATTTLPTCVINTQYLPPVGNQGLQGSCNAWASTYYVWTYMVNWFNNNPNPSAYDEIFSPAFVYNHINDGSDSGSYLEDAQYLIATMGACHWTTMPYNYSDYSSWGSTGAYLEAMKYRSIGYGPIYVIDLSSDEGLSQLKQLLADGYVVETGINVYSNFEYFNSTNDTYAVNQSHGSYLGGHAVTIIGYNDSLPTPDGYGAFRLVNSWGTWWGDKGYFWMTYNATKNLSICQGYAFVFVPKQQPYKPELIALVKINHSRRGDIIKGKLNEYGDIEEPGGIELGVGNPASPLWNQRFLDFIIGYYSDDNYQAHPFPDGYMAFDLTDSLTNVSQAISSQNITIYIKLEDKIINNITGKLEGFKILINATNYTEEINASGLPKDIPEGSYLIVNVSVPVVDYGKLTPKNNATLSQNWTIIDVESLINISNAVLELNGINHTMNKISPTYFIYNITGNGNYTYRVYINYSNGNIVALPLRTVVLDTIPPTISIIQPLNNSNCGKFIEVKADVTDNMGVDKVIAELISSGSVVNTTTLQGNQSNGVYFGELSAPKDGLYNITIIANDTSGNKNNNTVYNISVDTIPPTISINYPQNVTYDHNITLINVTVTDNTAVNTVIADVDGINHTMTLQNGYYITNVNIGDGHHTITIIANDTSGNVANKSISFTVDTIPPTISIIQPLNNSNCGKFIEVKADVTDNMGVDKVIAELISSGSVVNTTTLQGNQSNGVYFGELSAPKDGLYNITIIANDTSGNKNNNTVYNISVDTIPPTISINYPQNVTYDHNITLINVTVTDNTAVNTVIADVDGINHTMTLQNGYYITNVNIGDGHHTITIIANDTSGNVANKSISFTVDTIPPTITSSFTTLTTNTIVKTKNMPQYSSSPSTSNDLIINTVITSGHSHNYLGVNKDIKSLEISRITYISKLIVGSEVDADLSAKELKDTYDLINKPLEITDDTILVGGPVANPLTKKYMDKFPVRITNDYPGKNRGVIEAITLRVKVDENIYRDVTVVLLAGSDRWGTKAAVEYFKQLDDIPKEPIFVEWKDGKAVKIEKP